VPDVAIFIAGVVMAHCVVWPSSRYRCCGHLHLSWGPGLGLLLAALWHFVLNLLIVVGVVVGVMVGRGCIEGCDGRELEVETSVCKHELICGKKWGVKPTTGAEKNNIADTPYQQQDNFSVISYE
jgi:hypothetical protein